MDVAAGIETSARRSAWISLGEHYERVRGLHLRELFAADPKRGERLAAEAVGIYFDYSKNRITGVQEFHGASLASGIENAQSIAFRRKTGKGF